MSTNSESDRTPAPYVNAPLDVSLFSLVSDSDIAFLKSLCGITEDSALREHVLSIQKKAFAVHPYPCIRRFAFLRHIIAEHPAYPRVLSLGQKPPRGGVFLDVGCGFGQDVRKLVQDGFPVNNVVATDISGELWKLGHELFRSTEETFPVPFIEGNIFDLDISSESPPDLLASEEKAIDVKSLPLSTEGLRPLLSRCSAISASQLFHLFQEPQQLTLARTLFSLLSPSPGSIIFGMHLGGPEKGFDRGVKNTFGEKRFVHSPESWKELWEGLFREAGGECRVETKLVHYDRDGEINENLVGAKNVWILSWSVEKL